MVANHPSGFFDLAAAPRQPLAVAAWPTSPRKTRVRGFRHRASGQTSSRRRCRSMFTPGSRGCGYRTASGRHEWLNQDPIEEWGGVNLYGFVNNDSINGLDPLGLVDWENIGNQLNDANDAIIGAGPAGAEVGGTEKAAVKTIEEAAEIAKADVAAANEAVKAGEAAWDAAKSTYDAFQKAKSLEKCPYKGNPNFRKLKGDQGWKDTAGNIWKKDKKHKDHWDVSDAKGNKIKEIDFNGNQIWPFGPKNKNK